MYCKTNVEGEELQLEKKMNEMRPPVWLPYFHQIYFVPCVLHVGYAIFMVYLAGMYFKNNTSNIRLAFPSVQLLFTSVLVVLLIVNYMHRKCTTFKCVVGFQVVVIVSCFVTAMYDFCLLFEIGLAFAEFEPCSRRLGMYDIRNDPIFSNRTCDQECARDECENSILWLIWQVLADLLLNILAACVHLHFLKFSWNFAVQAKINHRRKSMCPPRLR